MGVLMRIMTRVKGEEIVAVLELKRRSNGGGLVRTREEERRGEEDGHGPTWR